MPVTSPDLANQFTIVPQGAFSLRESAEFGFGQRHAERYDGTMRLAFCLDRTWQPVGVSLRQDDAGVHGTISGPPGSSPDPTSVRSQVARVLSLDHDGRGFEEVGRRDPVIGRLQAVAPGLRPPLFYSPYEAAVWSVLSARRPARQMAEVRRRLSEEHGTVVEVGGQPMAVLPAPSQLLAVSEFPGLPGRSLERMHAAARAALGGQLEVDRLQRLGPEGAAADVQQLPGIGPFYSALIAIRATGFADVLPSEEPTLLGLLSELYGLSGPPTPAELDRIGDGWRPFRTWAAVLVRAAARRLPTPAA